MKVFVVVGYFGSDEWIEGIYQSRTNAVLKMEELWKTRSSPNGPEYAQKLKKFGVDEYELADW